MLVTTDNMVLFWRPEAYLSNWYVCPKPFIYDSQTFYNSEAAFMYGKAKLFDDELIVDQILANQQPNICKVRGRQVHNFNNKTWDLEKEQLMLEVCYAKFKHNPRLTELLLGTGDKMLVEASPYDNVWGIGLTANDPRALDVNQWRGQNLLGLCLMDVRTVLSLIK